MKEPTKGQTRKIKKIKNQDNTETSKDKNNVPKFLERKEKPGSLQNKMN